MSSKSVIEQGSRRIEWARTHMRVLSEIRKRFQAERPLKGIKVAMALHVEAKTAVLALTMKDAGASVRLASCNPLSTDDSVAIALNEAYNLETYARKGEDKDEYYDYLDRVVDIEPDFTVDDGGDLIFLLHTKRKDLLKNVKGGTEETTTGVIRLKAMERSGKLMYPVVDVNDAYMKHLFDNRYGTGQSTFDGILSATNLLVAGKVFVVAGYGWCGRGIAMRAKGLGASVVVTEVDPVKAIEAKLDGFDVMPMDRAVRKADFIVSSTGCKDVVRESHLKSIKDCCVLANAGHFDNEISKDALDRLAVRKRRVREHVEEYLLKNGNRVYLLSEGRLVNLAAGQGHPVEIMDLSFSLQALSVEYLSKHWKEMEPRVYPVPTDIDSNVARLKLQTSGIRIDALTKEQVSYLSDWKEGT